MQRKSFPMNRKNPVKEHEEKSPPTKAYAPMTLYSDEETEFLKACEREQKSMKQQGRRFLTATEILALAVKLGYRKLTPEQAEVFDARKRKRSG